MNRLVFVLQSFAFGMIPWIAFGISMSVAYVLGILTGLILAAVLLIFRSTIFVVRFEKYYFLSIIGVTMCASIVAVLLSQVPSNCNL
jgi:prolipoprotein diacylglyceryltransferase